MSAFREPAGGEADEILRHVPAVCFTGGDHTQIESGGVGIGQIFAVWRHDRMLDGSLGRVGGDSLFGDSMLWPALVQDCHRDDSNDGDRAEDYTQPSSPRRT